MCNSFKTTNGTISWTRVKHDSNGNPRYVCHFLDLLTEGEKNATGEDWIDISTKYAIALHRARQIGGRKFHNKQYGGGIVFQSYNLEDTESHIRDILAEVKP